MLLRRGDVWQNDVKIAKILLYRFISLFLIFRPNSHHFVLFSVLRCRPMSHHTLANKATKSSTTSSTPSESNSQSSSIVPHSITATNLPKFRPGSTFYPQLHETKTNFATYKKDGRSICWFCFRKRIENRAVVRVPVGVVTVVATSIAGAASRWW